VAAFAVVAVCIVLVLAIFWPTTASMIDIWSRYETFQHCFVVIPIVLWLVWRDRFFLAATPVRPYWLGLVIIAVLGFAWLLGVLGAAQVVSHFALIGLVAAVVLTAFGVGWVRILWFPLLFLFFAVPFGEAVVPRLMDWTADFTVTALRLSGVPVYREGVHFVIPTGQWSVIEACSGIKFLIASMMAGSLYAWLMYRSTRRRLLFLAASLTVPLIANWLRAYLIVMIGHLSNNRLMTNEDHIVFGWFLFGAAMLLLYWIGARWREDTDADRSPTTLAPATPLARIVPAAACVLAALVVWPIVAQGLMKRPDSARDTVVVAAPQPDQGWLRVAEPFSAWTPDLQGAAVERSFTYRKGARDVTVFVAAYSNQTQAAQVGSSSNQLAATTNSLWKQTARGSVAVKDGDSAVADPVTTAEVLGTQRGERVLLWHWYWVGETPTTSAARTKVELARARLARHPDTALWIALATPGEDRVAAERALREFARDMGSSLRRAFNETGAQ
jgi:exosortase A